VPSLRNHRGCGLAAASLWVVLGGLAGCGGSSASGGDAGKDAPKESGDANAVAGSTGSAGAGGESGGSGGSGGSDGGAEVDAMNDAGDASDAEVDAMTDAGDTSDAAGTSDTGSEAAGATDGSQGDTGTDTGVACVPQAGIDLPDDAYLDTNCDGIDGDASTAIFVASAGADGATCGLVSASPCAHVSFGVVRAVQVGRTQVLVASGSYDEVLVLSSGVNVYGGFDTGWQRALHTVAGHETTIAGRQDTTTGGDGEYLAVRAHDLLTPVTLSNVTIAAPAAQGASGGNGRSSYGVHVASATLTLEDVTILAGAGAPGSPGTAGLDATIVERQSYMNGQHGGDGQEFQASCNSTMRGASGPPGTNTCSASPSSRALNGGQGGPGGTMDTDCSVFSADYAATPGANGANATFVDGTFGKGGNGGSGADQCGPTTGGMPGLVANGTAGLRVDGGFVVGRYWYARAGGAGGTGENGSGGGGGGGGGGCDVGTDAFGPGGTGGGAGGCAARTAGGGGGGGGGSFGVFVHSGATTLRRLIVVRGAAGAGGAGGAGGRGQSGGLASDLAAFPGAAAPGAGGAGAHGGHGGGGAGGQGGRSIAVVMMPGTTVTTIGTLDISAGAAGAAGPSGASAPGAPLSEHDGNDGQTGSPGTVETMRTCVSATTC
jgi:hypothetical protein